MSIIYGVKKFYQYLAGRKFELVTDHKPLVTIFGENKGIPTTTAGRLQRWALTLSGFSYSIRYKPTLQHGNADGLSRLPVGPDPTFADEDSIQVARVQESALENSLIDVRLIKAQTSDCKLLKVVRKYVQSSWPPQVNKELATFYKNRSSLSVRNGCLLKDGKVIIPSKLQMRVIRKLHEAHQGVVKMKQLARCHCWWPTIDKDIADFAKACVACAKIAPRPKPEYQSWPEPEKVWSRLHMDFAGPFMEAKWLVVVDAKSKYPFVKNMGQNTSAERLIEALEEMFDIFGLCDTLVSDNGPPFCSEKLKNFHAINRIEHVTTACSEQWPGRTFCAIVQRRHAQAEGGGKYGLEENGQNFFLEITVGALIRIRIFLVLNY